MMCYDSGNILILAPLPRFVTHELLKRHLGYSMSLQEFTEIEVPPPYTEMA